MNIFQTELSLRLRLFAIQIATEEMWKTTEVSALNFLNWGRNFQIVTLKILEHFIKCHTLKKYLVVTLLKS